MSLSVGSKKLGPFVLLPTNISHFFSHERYVKINIKIERTLL